MESEVNVNEEKSDPDLCNNKRRLKSLISAGFLVISELKKKRSLKPTLLLILVCLAISSYSQNASDTIPEKTWTLRECVDYALAYNLQVRRGELNLEGSEIDLVQSKMALLPNANANLSYGYNWGRGLDPVTNQFVASQRNNVSSLGVSSSVTVFNLFRLQNTIKQSSRAYGASEQDLLRIRNDVTINVISLFLEVIFNKELVENARLQLASSQEQLVRTRKQVAAGSLAKIEELNLEAQVATNELNLINQENALVLSVLRLKQAMQIPASVNFDVDIPAIDPEDLILDQSRDEIFEIAKGTMPEIKGSQLNIQSSYYAVKVARANMYPRLSLNGSMNTNYSGSAINPLNPMQEEYRFNDQFNDNLYKSVSLSLILPIFNNHTGRSNVRRAMIVNEQSRITARETENTLRQNIETAYNDAVSSAKTYASSLKQVEAREEAFRITKQRYDIGASNYVEYQVAENNLFQARSDLARAKYNFIFRKRLLDFYQGKPIL